MNGLPGFNQYYPAIYRQWPSHEIQMYNRVGSRNARREEKLTDEQMQQYHRMTAFWLERGRHYRDATNYADDLCWVLACSDVLNVVTRVQ